MELIPILSLIILVATISTFVLAVGAYILYKIRERKGRVAQAPQPAAIPAEMITPAQIVTEQKTVQPGMTRTGERYVTGEYQQQPIFATSAQQSQQQGPVLRPTYVNAPPTSVTEEQSFRPTSNGTHATGESERFSNRRKFMRYTNEGYVAPKEEQKKQDEGLRWR